MKQTAVKWLEIQIASRISDANIKISATKFFELINQVKEMEKQQIIDAYEDGTYHNTFGNENYESSEEYYHKIFKSK